MLSSPPPARRHLGNQEKEYLFASLVGVPTFLLMFEDPGPSILIVDRTPIDFTIDKAAAFAALDGQLKSRGL